MNTLPGHSAVVIIGAGPSGLMMAAQLLRFGIQPVIIDSKTTISTESKALAVQARSLEIFRQMGLDDALLKEGNIAKGLVIHQDAEEVLSVDLSNVGEGKSRFPYVYILEQSKTERILVDFLTANTCPIYWNTQLLDVHQTDRLVNLKILRNDLEEIISCNWLVAADGASSKVRKSLHIPFSGGTYEHKFFLADISVDGVSADAVRAYFTENGFTAVFPMKDANYRVIGSVPTTLAKNSNVSFDNLKPYLTYNLGFAFQGETCNWFSVYELHHRMADQFRGQWCFLIGDAAHIHSPAGGQGMNTGLQDAYNLAWKLAGVIQKKYAQSVLNTYAEERMPVAKTLLKTTDRLFSVIVNQSWLIRTFRSWFLPFLNKIFKASTMNKRIFGLISQTGIHYRNSSLSLHHSLSNKIKAGDRLPYIKFFDEKLKEETDLHAWCAHLNFTLIIIGHLNQKELLTVTKWIQLTYPTGLSFFYLPPSPRNQHVFDTFEVTEKGRKALVVRPDMYVGYMNDAVDVELIGGYMEKTLGWGANVNYA